MLDRPFNDQIMNVGIIGKAPYYDLVSVALREKARNIEIGNLAINCIEFSTFEQAKEVLRNIGGIFNFLVITSKTARNFTDSSEVQVSKLLASDVQVVQALNEASATVLMLSRTIKPLPEPPNDRWIPCVKGEIIEQGHWLTIAEKLMRDFLKTKI